MTVDEIRTQYPQYDDMSDDELTDSLHKKYYSDMSLDDFHGKIGYKKEEKKSFLDSAIEPLKRIPEVFKEETQQGFNSMAQAVKDPSVGNTFRGALGGLQYGFAPMTALTKSLAKEPLNKISDEVYRQASGGDKVPEHLKPWTDLGGNITEAGLYMAPISKALQSTKMGAKLLPKTPKGFTGYKPPSTSQKLADAVGKPHQMKVLEKLPEKKKIQGIVDDAITQKLNTAKAFEKKGKTAYANQLRQQAMEDAQKLKAADGVDTEKAIAKAFGGKHSPLGEAGAVEIPGFKEIKEFFVPMTPERAQATLLKNATKNAAKGKAIQGVAPENQALVQKTTDLLKQVKVSAQKQKALTHKFRQQQYARATTAKSKEGTEWLRATEKGLTGKSDKVVMESFGQHFTTKEQTQLLNIAKESNLGTFESFRVGRAMERLWKGELPKNSDIALMKQVYGDDLTKAMLDNQSIFKKLGDLGIQTLNLPRAIMASVDLSAPFRQGVFVVGRGAFWKGLPKMVKQFGKEGFHQEVMSSIRSNPNYKLARDYKLAITEAGGADILKAEEAFMGAQLAEKIPVAGKVIRASNRAYTGFLSKLRMDLFDDYVRNAKKLGLDEVEMDRVLTDASTYINTATGRGKFGKGLVLGNIGKGLDQSAVAINSVFFSPKLMASRLQLLSPKYYMELHPMVRKQALRDLFTFAGLGMTTVGIASMAGADVETEITSSDFGKIKVNGKTRYDPWGGFQQYIVKAAQVISGKITSTTTGKKFTLGEGYRPITRLGVAARALEYKTAPIASLGLTLLRGKTHLGEDLNVDNTIAQRFTPMFLSDMNDIIQEEGWGKAYMGAPAAFGVGMQTYDKPGQKKVWNPKTRKFEKKPVHPDSLTENIYNFAKEAIE